jgi:serine/threonine protein phosphatase PrpC
MQGWRISNLIDYFSSDIISLIDMEDAHTHLLAIPDDKDAAFFAVYDGHGGAKVSQYAGTNLHKKIVQNAHYCKTGELFVDMSFIFLYSRWTYRGCNSCRISAT